MKPDLSGLARCQCGAPLLLRISRSPLPGCPATIGMICPDCFAAEPGRRWIKWLAVVLEQETEIV